MYAEIKSFGRYLPKTIITNNDLSEIVDTDDEWIYSRTGIRQRYISTNENTSELCAKVAEIIMKNAGLHADDIDIIIVATMTPDYLCPSTASIVQGKIGAKNAFAFDINSACSGFVFAISVAEKYIRSGCYKNAIVVGGEVLSKLVDYKDRTTCVLFGDGAAGVFIQKSETNCFIAEDLRSDGSKYKTLTARNIPVNNLRSTADAENQFLKMDGKSIYDFAIKNIPKSINDVLYKAEQDLNDVKYIVLHQANYRISASIAKKMKIPMDKFYTNMDKYGNTSSASIPIALSEMHDLGMLEKGDKIIISGFGAGLTWGSILLSI
jgi:3-oxoacyl-[acyl-carrier-protein] synthase III